jgi:hypothetical protein
LSQPITLQECSANDKAAKVAGTLNALFTWKGAERRQHSPRH